MFITLSNPLVNNEELVINYKNITFMYRTTTNELPNVPVTKISFGMEFVLANETPQEILDLVHGGGGWRINAPLPIPTEYEAVLTTHGLEVVGASHDSSR